MRRDQAIDYAKSITMGDRSSYNPEDRDAAYQLAHAQKLKEMAGYRNNPHLNLTEREALDSIFTKLSRICLGKPKEDNWIDLINYPAIAVESRNVEPAADPNTVDFTMTQPEDGVAEIARRFAPARK